MHFYDSEYTFRLRNDLFCVGWSVKLTALLPYCLHTSNMGAVVYRFSSDRANVFLHVWQC